MKTVALISALALLTTLGRSSAPEPAQEGTEVSGAYAADAGHSSVVFQTQHLGLSRFYGRFNEVSAELQYNEKDLAQSHVSIEIPVASIDTNNEKRDGHLESPDFFSAKEFPLITFESKSVRGTKDDFEISGQLEMRGVKKPITAKGRFIGSGDTAFGDFRVGFEARFTVEPVDFGFTFMEQNPGALGPEVEVVVSLECVRQ